MSDDLPSDAKPGENRTTYALRKRRERRKNKESGSGGRSQSQIDEAKRKYELAVESGVDPEQASFAFNYVPEGKTRVVTIQSEEGVGVNVTRGGSQRTSREVYRKEESELGREYAIPTDDQGRTRLDVEIQRRRYGIPSSQAFGGPLTYRGRGNGNGRSAVASGVRTYPIDFPVYGRPEREPSLGLYTPTSGTEQLRRASRGESAILYTPVATEFYRSRPELRQSVSEGLNIPIVGREGQLPLGQGRIVRTGLSFTRIPASLYRSDLSKFENLDLIRRELQAAGYRPYRASSRPGFSPSRFSADAQNVIPIAGLAALVQGATLIPPLVRSAGAYTAALAGPEISSRISVPQSQRRIVESGGFERVFQAGVEARRTDVGPARGFAENIPVVGTSLNEPVGEQRFKRAALREAQALGVQDPNAYVNAAWREYSERQRGAFFGLVGINYASELLGRTAFRSLTGLTASRLASRGATPLQANMILGSSRSIGRRAFSSIVPAGFFEGAGSVFVESEARRRTASPGEVLAGTAVGGAIAGFTGSYIASSAARRLKRARVIEGALDIVDPFERPGDILAGSDVARVVTPQGADFSFSGARVFDQTGGSRRSPRRPAPSTPARPTVDVGFVTPARTPQAPDRAVRVRDPGASFFDSAVGTPIGSQTPTPTRPSTRPSVPVQTPVQTPVEVPSIVPTPTPVQTPTRTATNTGSQIYSPVRSDVRIPIRTFTQFPVGGFPFEQGQQRGFGRGTRKRGIRGVLNLPSLTAAAQRDFNPAEAFTRIRGRKFTGLEIRGSKPKKKSRRVSLL